MRGIITLCGSTKFPEAFAHANAELTKADWCVLSVGTFNRKEYHDENNPRAIALKVQLDALHKAKISMSEAIVVLNVGGYIGDSTRSEIGHAWREGKKIYWLEPQSVSYPNDGYHDWKELLQEVGKSSQRGREQNG